MTTRALPVTGQPVEWSHVLCWLARDQALGLRQYFEWRNDDGTGLRRKVKDPPALTRLVLGLLSDAEANAETAIASVNNELTGAREALGRGATGHEHARHRRDAASPLGEGEPVARHRHR
ncbi:MAG: hypothetical protein IPQ09_13805 [Myxococcales bacterium]|nr:hypothetical protein [Myxococcales bacterium]